MCLRVRARERGVASAARLPLPLTRLAFCPPASSYSSCAISCSLADFDISVDTATRATVAYTRETTKVGAAGTEGFMAPEVFEHGATIASDVYSLGKTIAAVVTNGDDPALDALATRMHAEAPGDRPTARAALRDPCFSDIWSGRRGEVYECVVCTDEEEFTLSSGLLCTNRDGEPHFVCDKCLGRHARTASTAALGELAARDARISCPGYRCSSTA